MNHTPHIRYLYGFLRAWVATGAGRGGVPLTPPRRQPPARGFIAGGAAPPASPRVAALIAAVMAASAVLLAPAGCTPMRPTFREPNKPAPMRVVEADWDDVEAAVLVAAGRAEMAIERIQRNEHELLVELRTARAEPARLRITQASDLDPRAGPVPIRLEASVEPFGSPEQERRLLWEVERRLTQLRGRDYAPVR